MKSPSNPSFFTVSAFFPTFFTCVSPLLDHFSLNDPLIHGVHGSGDAQEDQVAEEELNEEPAPAGGSLLKPWPNRNDVSFASYKMVMFHSFL